MSNVIYLAIGTPEVSETTGLPTTNVTAGAILEGETLASLQAMTGGGFVDCLDLAHPETGALATFWFNDEGKILRLAPNWLATALYEAFGGELMEGDYLAGPVVITGHDPRDGETVSIPIEWLELLRVTMPGSLD